MKLFWHYGRTFAALLVLSLLLLIGQAACDLTTPYLMGDIAQNGLGEGTLAPGAPEALSLQGMTLLQCFMDQDDVEQMQETYLTFEPESSEARRLSEQYPGAVEQPICALREGLSEEQLTAAQEVYEKAAYTLLLYLQQEREAGKLEDISKKPEVEPNEDVGEFRDNLRDDIGHESSFPEGVLGNMPEGALFKLPSESGTQEESSSENPSQEESPADTLSSAEAFSAENAAGMQDSQEHTFGKGNGGPAPAESNSAENIAEKEARANSRPIEISDIDGMDIELIYTLLPRLGRTPEAEISALISSAEQGNAAEIRRAAGAFKKLFYREIGVPVEQLQSDHVENAVVKLPVFALLGLLSAVLAILLLSRIVTLMGEQLWHDLNSESEAVSEAIEELKRGLPLCLCALCTVPVWLIGSTVLLLVQGISWGWRIAVVSIVIAGLLLLPTKILEKLFAPLAKKLFQRESQRKKAGWLFPLSVTLLTWLMNLICAIVILAAGAGQSGAVAAFVQYAVQAVSSVLLAGILKAALSKAKALQAELEKAQK